MRLASLPPCRPGHGSLLLLTLLVATICVQAQPKVGHILPLEKLPGTASCTPTGLHPHGHTVVGYCQNDSSRTFRAVVWEDGQATEIIVPEYEFSAARGVNARGQVVGEAFHLRQIGSDAFIWDDGRVTILRSLSPFGARATSINDAGIVVGASWDAVMWTDADSVSLLPQVDAQRRAGEATAINNAGQITGSVNTLSRRNIVFWNDDRVEEIGVEWAHTELGGLSPLGDIALYEGFLTRNEGSLWSEGDLTPLGQLSGCDRLDPAGINSRKEIVGRACGNPRAFYWKDGELVNIGLWRDQDGKFWSITGADAISEAGQIAARSFVGPLGRGYAVLITPPGLRLTSPAPGVAGETNELLVLQAEPGVAVDVYLGPAGASFAAGCPELTIPVQARFALRLVANEEGRASAVLPVPADAAGSILRFVAVERGSCRVSPVVTHVFPQSRLEHEASCHTCSK